MNKNIFYLFILLVIQACRPYSQETISFEASTLGNIPDSTTISFGTNYDGNIPQIAILIRKNNSQVGTGILPNFLQSPLICKGENTYSFIFRGADTYNYTATTIGNVHKREEAKQWQGSFSASKDSACKTILLEKTALLPLNERAKMQFWLQAGTSLGFQSGDTTTLSVSLYRSDSTQVAADIPLLATATSFQPLCEASNNYPFAILSLPVGTYFARIKYAGTIKKTNKFTLVSGICTVLNL